MTGIFFDVQDNLTGHEEYYRDVGKYAKDKGHKLTVGNPGTMHTAPGYFDVLDIILVHETSWMPTPAEMTKLLEEKNISREKCAITPYAMTQLDQRQVQAATKWVKYVYVTDGILILPDIHPWGTLPPYLPDLFNALDPPSALP